MKSFLKLSLLIAFFHTQVSCEQESRISRDFTAEGIFTAGIEGPAVNAKGELFAVNFGKEGTIGKVDPNGVGKIFLELPEGSIGNGIRFDPVGNMYVADYLGHKVYQVPEGTNNPKVWAHNPDMNQPNDLALGPMGQIYLSDPNWGANTGKLWMVNPDGKVILLEDGMGTTNGIEVNPDESVLYVNESIQRKVWRYDIGIDGIPENKQLLISFEDFGLDGMRCDIEGNLSITRFEKGTVVVVSPSGKILEEIQLKGKKPSNITFGGKDNKTCYVTMADRGCIEMFTALFPGKIEIN